MTARERALSAVVEDGDVSGAQSVNYILDEIENSGFVLVDRELHETLVRAVRAVEWERVRIKTLLWAWDAASSRAYPVQRDAMNAEAGVELAALDRAVALLAERGSD